MSLLSLSNLTKRFGGLTAVNQVSFEVAEGVIAGLIGPNGAGKTTVFNLITGVYRLRNEDAYACGGYHRGPWGGDGAFIDFTNNIVELMGSFSNIAGIRYSRPSYL